MHINPYLVVNSYCAEFTITSLFVYTIMPKILYIRKEEKNNNKVNSINIDTYLCLALPRI